MFNIISLNLNKIKSVTETIQQQIEPTGIRIYHRANWFL